MTPEDERLRAIDEEAAAGRTAPVRKKEPERFRMLPASDIAERGVICSFILAPREVSSICEGRGVTSAMFHNPAFGVIYHHLQLMVSALKPVDPMTLTQWLSDNGCLEQCGGAVMVSELYTYLPTATNIAHYVDILEEKCQARRMIVVCTGVSERAYDEPMYSVSHDGTREPGLLDEAEREILAVRLKAKTHRGFTGKDVALIGMDALQHRWEHIGEISGLSTGFREIDIKTDGLHDGELIVLAARPSLGKSALAAQIAEHLSIVLRHPTGFLSLEMGKRQLSERLIASRAQVNLANWRRGETPSHNDIAWISHAAGEYAGAPLFFEELSDPTIQEVRGIGRRLIREHGIKALFIDSLSVLRSTSKQARENRAREVAECINGCKEMAKELQIPILVIAHIARGKADHEKPNLSNLRESGNVEQDADSVWMLWNPPPANGEETSGTELWIPKNRNGERFVSCPLDFQKECCRFTTDADIAAAKAHAEAQKLLNFVA